MAYTKKEWVDVANASSLSPEQLDALIPRDENGNKKQDALCRFDAANMNRIEEGINELANGGAIGSNASTENGGGAVGNGAVANAGFAGGDSAKTVSASGKSINAIQLGTGVNPNPKTLQIYDYQLMKADGTIPDERMPSKAPSGHGLGKAGATKTDSTYKQFLHHGCGFYQVNSDDAPNGAGSWMSLLQLVRTPTDGSETGAQIAFDDLDTKPKAWFRTVRAGKEHPWGEILHSGNYADFDRWVTLGSVSSSGTKKYSDSALNGTCKASILIPIDESVKEKYTSFRLIIKAGSYIKAFSGWATNSSTKGETEASMYYCGNKFATAYAFGGNSANENSGDTMAELNISKDEVVCTYSPEGITTVFTANASLGNESVTTKSTGLLEVNTISIDMSGLRTHSKNYVEWQTTFELQGRK